MRINIDDTDLDSDMRYLYQGEPFTGEAVETVSGGRVIAVTTYRNGREHGPSWEWYPDGQMKFEGETRDGRAIGVNRRWHRNGQLAEEHIFDTQGRLVSVRRWDDNGMPQPPT